MQMLNVTTPYLVTGLKGINHNVVIVICTNAVFFYKMRCSMIVPEATRTSFDPLIHLPLAGEVLVFCQKYTNPSQRHKNQAPAQC